MKFYRNERIEEIAEQRLREFEGKLGRPLSIPVDIELFGDLVLGLSMLWENIDELPGEEVLAGLRCLTQGHEMGHWDLFIDISKLDHPGLFADAAPSMFAYRGSTGGQVQTMRTLLSCEAGRDLVRQIKARADTPDEASALT
jgi:hypothetical protein